ncbi:GTP-binding protein [Caldimonas tepidiphila]|uniref:GTP-binding protein n=1 Tax=Caldimonas tepidiphila TaxID=2315841 RepID=UPI000E5AD365|nr:ATP/GTP-binding protein [Caldimonas tepidiphila]
MECSILFIGPVGAGKTRAVRSASDIEVVDTEARATDETARLKEHTTIAMDLGVIRLDARSKIRLYGAPGQDRFDFMWDILLEQSRGVVLLVDHGRADPLADLEHYLDALHRRMGRWLQPLVIGVTHVDCRRERPLDIYRDYLGSHPRWSQQRCIPVLGMDARRREDVKTVLMTLAAMMEMEERFAPRAA